MKLVADILRRQPLTFNYIEPDALVADAISLLQVTNRSFLVVMTGNSFQGIFSLHDYLHQVVMQGLEPDSVRVKAAMNTSLPFVSGETTVQEIIDLFYSHHISCIPVMDGSKFVGAITLHNLIGLLAEEQAAVF